MASILSVTKKPPTTLKRANPRDIDPIINNGLFGSAFIIAVYAANIVIPEMAFAPLIKGVWRVGGTFPINSRPNKLPSNKTQSKLSKFMI